MQRAWGSDQTSTRVCQKDKLGLWFGRVTVVSESPAWAELKFADEETWRGIGGEEKGAKDKAVWSSDIKLERQQGWSRGDAHSLVCHHSFTASPWGAVSCPGKGKGGAGGSALLVGPRWERSQGCRDTGHLAIDKAWKSLADLLGP